MTYSESVFLWSPLSKPGSDRTGSEQINTYNPIPLNLLPFERWFPTPDPIRSDPGFGHAFLWHDSWVQTRAERADRSSPIPQHTSLEQRRLVSSLNLYPPLFKPFTVQSGTLQLTLIIFSISVPLFYFIEWMNYRVNYMKVNVIFEDEQPKWLKKNL